MGSSWVSKDSYPQHGKREILLLKFVFKNGIMNFHVDPGNRLHGGEAPRTEVRPERTQEVTNDSGQEKAVPSLILRRISDIKEHCQEEGIRSLTGIKYWKRLQPGS